MCSFFLLFFKNLFSIVFRINEYTGQQAAVWCRQNPESLPSETSWRNNMLCQTNLSSIIEGYQCFLVSPTALWSPFKTPTSSLWYKNDHGHPYRGEGEKEFKKIFVVWLFFSFHAHRTICGICYTHTTTWNGCKIVWRAKKIKNTFPGSTSVLPPLPKGADVSDIRATTRYTSDLLSSTRLLESNSRTNDDIVGSSDKRRWACACVQDNDSVNIDEGLFRGVLWLAGREEEKENSFRRPTMGGRGRVVQSGD